jgi:uncharacterized protein YdaU (DUF1376 family)
MTAHTANTSPKRDSQARRKPSHIPLFPDAYHRDTTHLTTEEHGAYFLLLMAAWGSDDCTLPNDERRLAALAKMPVAKWRKIALTVLEFWTIDKGRISQKRLLKEWSYVREKSEKARQSVASRRDRNGYERSTNDVTNGLHLGGGGGVGGGSLPIQGKGSYVLVVGDEAFSDDGGAA